MRVYRMRILTLKFFIYHKYVDYYYYFIKNRTIVNFKIKNQLSNL